MAAPIPAGVRTPRRLTQQLLALVATLPQAQPSLVPRSGSATVGTLGAIKNNLPTLQVRGYEMADRIEIAKKFIEEQRQQRDDIIGAFVEPDEKTMDKKSDIIQYSVLAAGPISNVVLALIAILVLNLCVMPIQNSMLEEQGFVFEDIERLKELILEKIEQKRNQEKTEGAVKASKIIKKIFS